MMNTAKISHPPTPSIKKTGHEEIMPDKNALIPYN